MAESFITDAQSSLGRLELAWFTNTLPSATSADDLPEQKVFIGGAHAASEPTSDVPMSDAAPGQPSARSYGRDAEQGDLDVADDQDEDRWMK
jgi:hypothetical protein